MKNIKKLQFDKNKIYQYMFMEYVYFSILNNEDKLLKDEYFATMNVKLNRTSKVLGYLIDKSKKIQKLTIILKLYFTIYKY